ncbi:hypothetical protein [Streptomyces sp. 900116325]
MPENTGPVAAQHRAEDATLEAAYNGLLDHTMACTECRAGGMDCTEAAALRQAYRAAKERARRSV